MIYAKLVDLPRYSNIPYLEDILKFIKGNDLFKLADGDYDILGKDLYIRVMHYQTEPTEKRKFEAHRFFSDLQIILTGTEKIQIATSDERSIISDYDQLNDVQFFSTPLPTISDVNIEKDQFVFFSPGELHRPMCDRETVSGPVFKIVFKIKE